LCDGEIVKEGQIFRYDANGVFNLESLFKGMESGNDGFAGSGSAQPGENLEQGRFSSAVRPKKSADAAGRDFERKVVNGRKITEPFGDAAAGYHCSQIGFTVHKLVSQVGRAIMDLVMQSMDPLL